MDTHLFLCQTGKWVRQIMGVQDSPNRQMGNNRGHPPFAANRRIMDTHLSLPIEAIVDTHLFLCQTGKWVRQIMGVQDFIVDTHFSLPGRPIVAIMDAHLFLRQTGKWVRQIMGVQDFQFPGFPANG